MDRFGGKYPWGPALARAGSVAGAVYEAKGGTGSTQMESEWNIGPNLDRNQQAALRELLREYPDVFARNPKSPNTTHVAHHVINTNEQLPIKAKNIQVSPQTEREINEQVEQMLSNGIIRPSTSPWASRVILVRKKYQTLRFAVDYLSLNDVTIKDSYPFPEFRDIQDKLSGSKFFSTLDGASAYWSIPIVEEDRRKTAFITPRGQFEFCVMPFGLCNAPATYQRAIDNVLKNATHSEPYIDDTLTYSSSFGDHSLHLREVFKCYSLAGFQLRRDKCRFGF